MKDLLMFERKAISRRFFLCYAGKSRRETASVFGIRKSTVTEWNTKGMVPWSKIKYLSDSQGISYDWLIEGFEPKLGIKQPAVPRSASPKFSRNKINQRYLSLFGKMTHSEIARSLGITPGVVHEWHKNIRSVSWKRLSDAVERFGVRWDWLLDGLEPKYREDRAERQENGI